jgi:hypothetical protein
MKATAIKEIKTIDQIDGFLNIPILPAFLSGGHWLSCPNHPSGWRNSGSPRLGRKYSAARPAVPIFGFI